ncbi:HIG1 domain family member 2A, mitochondrial [Anastrepha obliqua]|uniref:HIG1 domain family member 2A, mitochondrial n=1 Tax=Anastrepha ludens TaxID=28586 RepID=UPI0023AF1203|nr:HIG1 domain family member 2A, mitochondrial [Anastrepha ludens]XP_054728767.1 HIG1 domain family member 2A, mitochondrial [Anastrepha obliqua]
MGKEEVALPDEELDWIQLRRDFGSFQAETTKEKMIRKIKENPAVPIGCLTTAGALTYGLYNFRTGNRRMSQIMMRTRIAAQGFTVLALVIGVVMTYDTKQ